MALTAIHLNQIALSSPTILNRMLSSSHVRRIRTLVVLAIGGATLMLAAGLFLTSLRGAVNSPHATGTELVSSVSSVSEFPAVETSHHASSIVLIAPADIQN